MLVLSWLLSHAIVLMIAIERVRLLVCDGGETRRQRDKRVVCSGSVKASLDGVSVLSLFSSYTGMSKKVVSGWMQTLVFSLCY